MLIFQFSNINLLQLLRAVTILPAPTEIKSYLPNPLVALCISLDKPLWSVRSPFGSVYLLQLCRRHRRLQSSAMPNATPCGLETTPGHRKLKRTVSWRIVVHRALLAFETSTKISQCHRCHHPSVLCRRLALGGQAIFDLRHRSTIWACQQAKTEQRQTLRLPKGCPERTKSPPSFGPGF